jgi:hypothetical protein
VWSEIERMADTGEQGKEGTAPAGPYLIFTADTGFTEEEKGESVAREPRRARRRAGLDL